MYVPVPSRFSATTAGRRKVSLEGDPKTKIIDFAKEWGAELVVVGSCDLPAVERFFVGSVSQGVVKHSPCSVLVEKPRRDKS
jgi:nucleotide-binding universal stress UspA family protein